MSVERPPNEPLAELVAWPLRVGTLSAVALVALGVVVGFLAGRGSDPPPGTPLFETIAGGGSTALIAAGLFLLTLVPMAMGIGAIIGFASRGDRRYLIASIVVVVLLLASLIVPAVFLRSPS